MAAITETFFEFTATAISGARDGKTFFRKRFSSYDEAFKLAEKNRKASDWAGEEVLFGIMEYRPGCLDTPARYMALNDAALDRYTREGRDTSYFYGANEIDFF